MNNFWTYYNAFEAFVIKEFYIITVLLLFAILSKTVLKKNY